MATDVVHLSLDTMLARFRFLGEYLNSAVYNAMLVSANKMLADVTKLRMSNPRRGSTSTNLGVDTGTARRSMIDRVGVTPEKIFALIGSPVDYVKTHEEGFHGVAHVRAHTRQLVSLSRNTKTGLVSKISAGKYKKAIRKNRKTIAYVRPYARKVDIIGKHFIRDTVAQAVIPTQDRITTALVIAAKTGRVPAPSQLGA